MMARELATGLVAAIALSSCTEVPPPPAKDASSAAVQPAPSGPVAFGPGADFKLEAVPAVPPLEGEETAIDPALVELLKSVKAARKLDRDPGAEPKAKADAWGAVAAHAEPNPFKGAADKRAGLWREAADAKARRAAEVETLRSKLTADRKRLAELTASVDDAKRTAIEDSFVAAYAPYEGEISTWAPTAATPTKAKPKETPKAPLADPLGRPFVVAQRVIVKADFGAHAQSFSVDTSDNVMSTVGGAKPTYDLSGFYAGGEAAVNVASQSDLAIGIIAYGRYHVTTSLPDSTFVSGTNDAATVAEPDAGRTGAFAVGGGARLAGNITERIAMEIGLTGGYLQFLAPANVPGCGPDETPWDPALRGFQGELFVGAEFYPLSVLSFGVSGRVGFGHVQGQWCVPGKYIDPSTSSVPDSALDVSADSFSVGAQGEIGVHF